jgi:hypothetical protein
MDWNHLPKRSSDLEINEVTDGYVVSRRNTDRIHYLNATAIFILESCDGSLRAGELPGLVAVAFGLDHSPVADVEHCLTTLIREGLIIDESTTSTTNTAGKSVS